MRGEAGLHSCEPRADVRVLQRNTGPALGGDSLGFIVPPLLNQRLAEQLQHRPAITPEVAQRRDALPQYRLGDAGVAGMQLDGPHRDGGPAPLCLQAKFVIGPPRLGELVAHRIDVLAREPANRRHPEPSVGALQGRLRCFEQRGAHRQGIAQQRVAIECGEADPEQAVGLQPHVSRAARVGQGPLLGGLDSVHVRQVVLHLGRQLPGLGESVVGGERRQRRNGLLDQTVRLLENRLAPDDPCPAVPNPGSPLDRDLALRSGAGRDLGQQVSGADRLSGFEQRVGQRQPQLVAARVTLRQDGKGTLKKVARGRHVDARHRPLAGAAEELSRAATELPGSRVVAAELRPVAPCLLDVIAEDLLVRPSVVTHLVLQPVGETLVQVGPHLFGNATVGRVSDQVMAEPERIVTRKLGPVRPDELLAHQRQQMLADLGADLSRQQIADRATVEQLALERGAFYDGALVRLEAVDARGEQRLDRRRNANLPEVVLGAHRQHLLDEQRVAFGCLEEALAQVRRQLGAREQLLDE